MSKMNMLAYAAIGIGIATLVFVFMFVFQGSSSAQDVQSYAADECGDLGDAANIQHLSHHPQQYKDCLKQVNPQKFYDATGQNLNDFMRRNGIG